MKIRIATIWRFVPVPVLYVHALPGRLVGVCLGPAVVVRSDFCRDHPTLVHELTHCRQFWRGLGLVHFTRYYVSRRYRLAAELEAFRAELDACTPAQRGPRLQEASRALATCYGLDLDPARCRQMLDRPAGRRGAQTISGRFGSSSRSPV